MVAQQMHPEWESTLKRWAGAGLIDGVTAERIRAYEAAQPDSIETPGLRWPVIVAIAFGCVMVGAGILLLVAAHWDDFSPTQRFLQVLLLVAGFHVAGALSAERFPTMSKGMHALGTLALGAGIFLSGQIFNLAEHWPSGIMLWALGAALGWLVLRDAAQGALLALLLPAWIGSEWYVRVVSVYRGGEALGLVGLLTLSICYLTADTRQDRTPLRRGLAWIGGGFFFPAVIAVIISSWEETRGHLLFAGNDVPASTHIIGWMVAILVPLAISFYLRGSQALANVLASGWVFGLYAVSKSVSPENNQLLYLWCLVGAVGLTYWGVSDISKERINLGVTLFGFTVLAFYFSSIFDKLGRSMALISLGALFLLGGWGLEKMRRRLVARAERSPA